MNHKIFFPFQNVLIFNNNHGILSINTKLINNEINEKQACFFMNKRNFLLHL